MNGLKIAKVAVLIMSLLIVGVLALCLNTVHKQYKSAKINSVSQILLNEPEGSSIKNIVAMEKELYIMVSGGGKSDRIVVVSPESRKVMYSISVD